MRALRSFPVRPRLPHNLEPLNRLAMNLRWSWDPRTRDLFRWVDPELWDATRHDPVGLLGQVPRERLDALASDAGFLRFLGEIDAELERYLSEPRWFQGRAATSPLRLVAYFSPEFGISEALPQYSGGLGVLAGDHLKAASDLGVPIAGIGLFYRNGYFRQSLSLAGWQQEVFPSLDPYAMALTLEEGVRITVDLAGQPLTAQVWRADVGRTRLYLLDADIDENTPELRAVTDRLYGGDTEHRLRQEILLGMGGVKALRALDLQPQVFHTNEGHAGFLSLERIAQLRNEQGLSLLEAVEAVRAGGIFTTHTPVPAGIDRFPRELIERYFSGWCESVGADFELLMALGHRAEDGAEDRFNMAVMGLRLAGRSNGVAKLHGEVSREMFRGLWSDIAVDEVPITSVTNGVHAATWTSNEMSDLLSHYVLPDWVSADDADFARLESVRDDELWRAREQGRERLVAFVRERLRASLLKRGMSVSDVAFTDEVLDPRVLTIGFARRFASYKRATLLLGQEERLRRLLTSADTPVQFVFAGKAHPADDTGKGLIQQVQQFTANDPTIRHRFVFLEDYDIAVARAFVQGCDVWLNTPRRPQEASGTSGMKAALNGALNLSIMDGWWDEMFDGENGWAISSAEAEPDVDRRDRLEANSLFELLEHQVVPLFYAVEGRVPRRWLAKVRHSLQTLVPQVNASRMVRDYVQQLYEPAAASAERFAADGWAAARELAAWKDRVRSHWEQVAIVGVDSAGGAEELGSTVEVTVHVALGGLEPGDVSVQIVHGPVTQGDELAEPETVACAPAGFDGDGTARFTGSFVAARPGRYGFTIRVLPVNALLQSPVELGRVIWAS